MSGEEVPRQTYFGNDLDVTGKRIRDLARRWLPPAVLGALRRVRVRRSRVVLPDAHLYDPLFSPWLSPEFARLYSGISAYTLVSPDRCWILWSLARQACRIAGDVLEIGVYRGGTAMLLRQALERESVTGSKTLRLFDTFAGMPETDRAHDLHRAGDFSDTSVEAVRGRVGTTAYVEYYPGTIPYTFAAVPEKPIAFVHVDVDIYRSVLDACAFIYPRLVAGGIVVFDDYGFPSCPGARRAVDEFFGDKRELPLVLPTGQAVVVRIPDDTWRNHR